MTIASGRFDGLSLVEQHRLVYEALAAPLGDGSIHELRIKTKGTGMSELRDQIKEIIENEPVSLFMKGTPQFVMCGNSDRALRALRAAGAPVTAVDVLPDPQIRQELSALSGWPTIPQVFVKGELVGGADIVEELHASGELEAKLDEALGADRERARRRAVVSADAHRSAQRRLTAFLCPR